MFSQFDAGLKYIGESNREQLSPNTVYIMNERGEYLHKESYEFWDFWKESIILHEKEDFGDLKGETPSFERICDTLAGVYASKKTWTKEQVNDILFWAWGEATIH